MSACNFPVFDPSYVNNYYLLAGVATLLMASYIMVKMLAGKFMEKPEWEAAANVELSQLWFSLIILISAVAFLDGSTFLFCSLFPNIPASKPPTVLASEFLQNVLFKGVLEAINDVFTIQVFYSIFNTFNFRPHEAVWTWTYKIAPGADAVVGITNTLSYGLIALFGSISAQIAILSLIDTFMYPFILPAGLLLRFFPPTRDAGVFLIALAFGFQVIFPSVYVLNKMILDEMANAGYIGEGVKSNVGYQPYIASTSAGILKWSFISSAATLGLAGGIFSSVATSVGAKIGLAGPANYLGTFIGAATLESTAYSLTFVLFRPILMTLGELSVVSLFLPALATMVTFAFINGVTKFIIAKT